MKKVTWKDIAELVGISAIVASLMFVGLQMKQARSIAIADSYQQQAGATLAKSELALMHSELIAKANRGEALSDAEEFALLEYVTARWQHAYFGRRRSEYLERSTGGPVQNFSGFLCNNPGPRGIWEIRSEILKAGPPGDPLEVFANEVDSFIERNCSQ
jgi:hypothetical protein